MSALLHGAQDSARDSKKVSMSEPPSLRSRVLSTGLWIISGGAVSVGLRFVSSLVLTRLLQPELFGLMAAATTVVVGLAMLSDVGLTPAVVQSKKGNNPEFLNTAWIVQILRGAFLTLCGVAVALLLAAMQHFQLVPAASVYADQTLPPALAALSTGFLIGGFQSTKLLEASRHLSIGRITQIEIVTQLFGMACTLLGALMSRSAWALVAGALLVSITKTLATHAYLDGTSNRWSWNKRDFKDLLHFGKWIFVSSTFGFLANQGDRLLLGAILDATVFGVYVIAYQLFWTIESGVARMVGNISFPALSEVARDRPASLKSTLYKLHTFIGPMSYFQSGLLMVSGQVIVDLLYDNRYAQAGWMLQMLGVALLAAPFGTSASSLVSMGMPRLFSSIPIVRAVTLYVAAILGHMWFGVPGALWGVVISYLVPVPLILFFQIRHGLVDVSREVMLLVALPLGMAAGALFNFVVRQLFQWVP
jgi:O-antigen/teichoic acid export membrane protein